MRLRARLARSPHSSAGIPGCSVHGRRHGKRAGPNPFGVTENNSSPEDSKPIATTLALSRAISAAKHTGRLLFVAAAMKTQSAPRPFDARSTIALICWSEVEVAALPIRSAKAHVSDSDPFPPRFAGCDFLPKLVHLPLLKTTKAFTQVPFEIAPLHVLNLRKSASAAVASNPPN